MSVEVKLDKSKNYIQVVGDLTNVTVMQVLNQITRETADFSRWVIDLSKIARVDSTAVALLIELKKIAHNKNREVSFVSLPKSLLAIARLSQVDALITENS